MVKPTNSTPRHQKQHGQTSIDSMDRSLKTEIKQLIDQIHVEREESIKEKVKSHRKHLEHLFSMVKPVIVGRESLQTKKSVNMLSSRIDNPLCKLNTFSKGMVEKEAINNVDISSAKSIRISPIEKLPPYTSWVYVARNVKMAKDQSVIGKIQIYHDTNKGETVICSDNEEEIVNFENVKHDFTEAEDYILRMTIEEYGYTEEVLSIVKEIVKTTDLQIQERYKKLKEKNMLNLNRNCEDCDCTLCESHLKICWEKSLNSTLESLNNLFCRQCLIFDCPVHGISQPLIYHSESQPVWFESEGDKRSCSDQCYILVKDVRYSSKNLAQGSFEYRPMKKDSTLPLNESSNSSDEESCTTYHTSLETIIEHTSKKLTISGSCDHGERGKRVIIGQKDLTNEVQYDERTSNSIWKPLEKDLFLKGKEMFGKNSCLIASNLLPGLKTCLEVAKYMFDSRLSTPHGSIPSSMVHTNKKIDTNHKDQEMSSKSRSLRKKGKPKKFTSSRKSAGLPPSWRRIAYGKTLRNKQYTPCGCCGTCGKQCPCLINGTCCEKYCGCLKVCNNRFRGCYCVKSQCRSRLCPCFAANRECDPDVCRYCWVSYGDGSLREPPHHGEGQCENMNILLGQKERILLAKSNVTGWGVFAKNSINKNVCLGEYTGELIPQEEADKRGKLYIRINNSYLFNLNDQWVIDARRLGDKLKFANHSSKPNCYLKVTLVGGDHRVGIYAKENIEAGDELLYDYYYDLDCAPLWALPSKARASKKNELSTSHGKAKKQQFH